MAEKITSEYGHLLGREVSKEDLDALFSGHHEPKGLMISVLRWTLGMNGIPAPEKWIPNNRKAS